MLVDPDGTLVLTELQAKNYQALKNYLAGFPVTGNQHGSQFRKNPKKRQRKLELLAEQNFRCIDCGMVFEEAGHQSFPTATADHIIPYRYGSNLSMNVEFVCGPCNNIREYDRLKHIMRYFGLTAHDLYLVRKTGPIRLTVLQSQSNKRA